MGLIENHSMKNKGQQGHSENLKSGAAAIGNFWGGGGDVPPPYTKRTCALLLMVVFFTTEGKPLCCTLYNVTICNIFLSGI